MAHLQETVNYAVNSTGMENKEIAHCLNETADLMEIAGEDSFRIRSYRNGATAVEGHSERVAEILRNPERKVTDIPGIGKGLAGVIGEIVERGSCERRDLLLQKYPAAAPRCEGALGRGADARRTRWS